MNILIFYHKGIGEEKAIQYLLEKYKLKEIKSVYLTREENNYNSLLKLKILKKIINNRKVTFNTIALCMIEEILRHKENGVLLKISLGMLENANTFSVLLDKYEIRFDYLISLEPHIDMLRGLSPPLRIWPESFFQIENYKILNKYYFSNELKIKNDINNLSTILNAKLLNFTIGKSGVYFGHEFRDIFDYLEKA